MALPSALQRKRQEIESTTPALDDNGIPILVQPQSPPVLTVVPNTPAPAPEDTNVQFVPSLEPDFGQIPASENLMEMFNEFEEDLNAGTPTPNPTSANADTRVEVSPTLPHAAPAVDSRYDAMLATQNELKSQLLAIQGQLAQRDQQPQQPQQSYQVGSFGIPIQAAPAYNPPVTPQPQPTAQQPQAFKFEAVQNADIEALLSAEERATYAGSLPIITRIANRAAEAAANQMQARLSAQEQASANLTGQFHNIQRNTYDQALHVAVPDIDDLMTDPGFATFMAKPVPYTAGETLKDRLGAAHRSGNVKIVSQIFNEFRAIAKAAAGSQPGVAQLQTPPVVAAAPTPTQPQAKKMLAWSKRDEAFRSFRAGKITQADLSRVQNMYAKAEAQGRIDYNA